MDYSSAINDLRFLETRFKNLIEVIPHLTELGSLENAVDEAKRQIEALKGEIEDLGKAKVKANGDLDKVKVDLDNHKSDFDVWQKAEIEKTNAQARAIIKDAQDKAQSIVALASAKASDVEAALKQDQALLDSLKTKIAEATDQYDDITSKLQSIKASL